MTPYSIVFDWYDPPAYLHAVLRDYHRVGKRFVIYMETIHDLKAAWNINDVSIYFPSEDAALAWILANS